MSVIYIDLKTGYPLTVYNPTTGHTTNTYFKTHLHYLIFKIYHIPTTNFNFVRKLFVVEETVVVIAVSQVVLFILIQLFLFVHINTIMNSHTFGYYCYCHHYFTVHVL